MDDENTPTVTVLLSDLEVIQAALNSAYHQNFVFDLADQYRKLNNRRTTQSAMTKALQGAIEKIDIYVAEAQDAEPVS